MVRVPRLTKPYHTCFSELRLERGSTEWLAVARAVATIAEAPTLPLPVDVEGALPARQRAIYEKHEGRALLGAYAHRVGTRRLWVWYRLRDPRHVDFVAVTRTGPASTPGV